MLTPSLRRCVRSCSVWRSGSHAGMPPRRRLHGGHLGSAVVAADPGAATFQAAAPAQGGANVGPMFACATPEQVDRVVGDAAAAAAHELRHAALYDPSRIAALLEAAAGNIAALPTSFIDLVSTETGYDGARVRGERTRAVEQLRMFASLVADGSWVDARVDVAKGPGTDLRRMLVPLGGPVGVWSASNFPLAFSVAGGDTASALAAGNPVVVKAHPAHPGTSECVAEAVRAAAADVGLPAAVLCMLHGNTPDVSLQLVRHPALVAAGFTGSLAAGRSLMDAAAARPRPITVHAEMGSVNPVFVLPEAMELDHGSIATGLAASLTLGAGQFCTNPGVCVVRRGEAMAPFLDTLTRAVRRAPPDSMLTAGMRQAYECGADALASHPAVAELTPERRPAAERCEAAGRLFSVPAPDFLHHVADLSQEVFGPAGLVVVCDSDADMLAVATALHGQLTASVWAPPSALDAPERQRLLSQLSTGVGRLIFNGFPTGVQVSAAMTHGGPYPAASSPQTSVGTGAIFRFARPLTWQDAPPAALPPVLRDGNPLHVLRTVNGVATREAVADDYTKPR